MKHALSLLLAGCVALVACGKSTTPDAAREDAAPPPRATACDSRMTEIDRVISSASNKCTADKDCVCFRGGVSTANPCGGIVDAKTNERFESLAKDFSAAGCHPPNVMCAAMLCEPKCNGGTCGPRQLIQ